MWIQKNESPDIRAAGLSGKQAGRPGRAQVSGAPAQVGRRSGERPNPAQVAFDTVIVGNFALKSRARAATLTATVRPTGSWMAR